MIRKITQIGKITQLHSCYVGKSVNRYAPPFNAGFSSRGFSSAAESPTLSSEETEAVPESISLPLSSVLKPKEVVAQLNKFIVGQPDAKRAVAIALRNRWRRFRLTPDLKNETEIARRIAKLSQAPFIKVEATKFTEVGFHGKDVDHIIRDLMDISINMTKKRIKEAIKERVAVAVNDKILDILLGSSKETIDAIRTELQSGAMEDYSIEIDVPARTSIPDKGGNPFFGVAEGVGNTSQFGDIFKTLTKGT
eukprot:gene22743-31030_t